MSERSKQLDPLIAAYLDHRIGNVQYAELLQAVRDDDEAGDLFAGELEMHHLLQLSEGPGPGDEEKAVDRILYYVRASAEEPEFLRRVERRIRQETDRVETQPAPSLWKRRKSLARHAHRTAHRFSAYLAVAAGLLLTLGVGLLLRSGPAPILQSRKRPIPKVSAGTAPSTAGKSDPSQPGVPGRFRAGETTPVGADESGAATAAGSVSESTRVASSAPRRSLPAPPTIPALTQAPPHQAPTGGSSVRKASAPPEAAGPQRTAPALARLGRIVGSVRYARGPRGRWTRAAEGIRLLPGDRLDTRSGLARLEFTGRGEVYVNRSTLLQLLIAETGKGQAALVVLNRGQIYVTEPRQTADLHSTSSIHVETPDGLLSPVGTRFDVQRRFSSTVVTVEQGEVEARSKVKRKAARRGDPAVRSRADPTVDLRRLALMELVARVAAGRRVRLRRGQPPPTPVRADARRATAWTRALVGERVIFSTKFEQTDLDTVPAGWQVIAGRGRFAVVQGAGGRVLRQTDAAHTNTEIVLLHPEARAWSGYTIRFNFRPLDLPPPDQRAWVMVYGHRESLAKNYRLGILSDGTLTFLKRAPNPGAGYQTLKLKPQAGGRGVRWIVGTWYTAEFRLEPLKTGVRLLGRVWRGSRSGRATRATRAPAWSAMVLDASDPSERALRGSIGFGTTRCKVEIDNVEVVENR